MQTPRAICPNISGEIVLFESHEEHFVMPTISQLQAVVIFLLLFRDKFSPHGEC